MRHNLVPYALIMSTIFLTAAPAALSKSTKSEEIPCYRKVSDTLYRGGQPSALGIKQLKSNGIKTIISFRNNRKLTACEQAEAKKEGLNYYNIPLDGIHKPTESQINQFLTITNDQQQQPVFVHCQHGQDRTGVMCAIYREENNKWSAHDAYSEAVKNGFHERYVWLADSVYDYAESKHMSKSARPIAVKLRDSIDHLFDVFGSKSPKAPAVVATDARELSSIENKS